MHDPSVVAWEWVSPDERAVAFARRDIAAVLPSGWKVDLDADGEIGIIGPRSRHWRIEIRRNYGSWRWDVADEGVAWGVADSPVEAVREALAALGIFNIERKP